MRICFRCNTPFEPVAEEEVICPKCTDSVNTRFLQLFGDEDPYSPQPTLRTNKIARVIVRKNQSKLQKEKEDDIAAKSMEPVDRYDDD
jgi:type IV secretory pathway component VirB8